MTDDQAQTNNTAEAEAPEAETAAPEAPAKPKTARAKRSKVTSLRAVKMNMTEPYKMIRFPAGQAVEVAEVTTWMKAQLAAGLLEQV